mgnify:CR=1
MHIKQIVESTDGNYEFQAELTGEQHAFLIEFAIKELLAAGLIPFANSATKAQQASLVKPVLTEQ